MRNLGSKIMIIGFSVGVLCLMSGCGNAEYEVVKVECDSERVADEIVTTCSDGKVFTFPIPTVVAVPGVDGNDGIDGLPGLDGIAGVDGIDGLPGVDAEPCTSTVTSVSVIIQCPGSDPAIIPIPSLPDSDDDSDDDDDDKKEKCNNGKGNGSEGCRASDNGNNDED